MPIGGRPLLAHVLEAFARSSGIDGVRIAVEPGAEERCARSPRLPACRSRFVASAADDHRQRLCRRRGRGGPLVITTADNVLLTAGRGARGRGAARGRRRHGRRAGPQGGRAQPPIPKAQRRFYKFRDGGYSNCNLYGLSQRGLKLAETFRERRAVREESDADRPRLRLPQSSRSCAYGLVTLERRNEAVRPPLRRDGVSALMLADGAHAIDVDNQRTYEIAAQLLDRRAA